MNRRFWAIVTITVILLFNGASMAESGPSVMSSSIYRTDWQWKAGEGGAVTFEGNVICENVSESNPLIMRLSADNIKPESDLSEPVFKKINEKNQGNRHPPKEVTITSSEQAIRFSGYWTLPEATRIDEALIHLKIYDRNEQLLSESELLLKNDQILIGNTESRLPETGNLIKILFAAAAFIWILAVVRIIRNRKRR